MSRIPVGSALPIPEGPPPQAPGASPIERSAVSHDYNRDDFTIHAVKHPDIEKMVYFSIHKSLADWKNLTDEEYRVFQYPEGEVRVDNPALVYVKAPPAGTRGGGSMRIILLDGSVQYIPYGWLSFRWVPRKGCPTVAF